MSSRLCPFCMQMSESETCPYCGKNVNYSGSPAHLPAGYVVSGKHPYVLGAALGQGGFGITYIALDMVTNERVAIKEYYPSYCSTRTNNNAVTAYSSQEEVYQKGKERFLDEARTLKSLSDLKNIVNVLDFFEANNSAYLVMEFLEGSSLKEYAAKNGKFPAQKFLEQIRPLMEDIERMHQRGVIHRDIAPDNIILSPDGQMKLIDFGTARSYVGDKSMTVVVKKGFAPVEQYFSSGSTPSTDVYALAATIYYCITGVVPMDSAQRQNDGVLLEAPSALGVDTTLHQEKALAKAFEIQQKDRTQSVQEFLDGLNTNAPEKPKIPKLEPDETVLRRRKATAGIIAMILTILVVCGFVLGSWHLGSAIEEPAWKQNVLMADPTYDEDYAKFWASRDSADRDEIMEFFSARPVFNTDIPRSKITEVFFLDSFENAPEAVYDVSASQDGTVLAWTVENEKDTLNLYIAGEGGVNGEEACRAMFYGYTALELIHFNNCFFTDTTQDMSDMFAYCTELIDLNLSGFVTSNVTTMKDTFKYCSKLTSLDLSNFDTSKVTDMSYMFNYCDNLTSLDLSNFDTSNVTDIRNMFCGCFNLASLDLSNFDTSNVTNMHSVFFFCHNLTSLDLSNFDTSNVTDMNSMFAVCYGLISLDLSNFDTSKVTDMNGMFAACKQLTSLDLSNFDTSNVTNYKNFMDDGKALNGRPWEEWFS